MNIVRENIDALNVTLTVKVEKADYESNVESTLRTYRRKAQVPGFRPGMVPLGMIKKMYLKSAVANEVFKQMSDGINSYIRDNNLNILGEPLPGKNHPAIDIDTQSDFEFIYDVALAPEVHLTVDSSFQIPCYTIAVTDEDVQHRIDYFRAYYGKSVSAERIEKDFLVIADLAQDGQNGINVERAMLSLKVIPEAEQQTLIGLSVDDSVEVNVRNMFVNDTDCAALLRIPKAQLEEINPVFTVTVREITNMQQAEVNQEFFDAVYGKDVVTTEEEFADKIKSDLSRELANKSEHRFALDVRSVLIEKAAIELPEAFLKRWLLQTTEEDEERKGTLTEESIEADYPHFADTLRWQLVSKHIVQQQNIEVTEDDLLTIAKKTLLQRLAMYYGINTINEDRLTEFAQNSLNDPDERKRIIEQALESRVIEYARQAATIELKEVSNEQFNKLHAPA
ncbi:MAG: trigger factor [Prevotellaceae bacterium]|jgi:trigger factor|nr:trigger factor [Prevotellaceae bacterium]